MRNYAIYGAGAMGTILGAYIAKANVNIDLISRNAAHVAALKEKGASVIGKAAFTQKVSALLPEEMNKKYDVIFLMTKQRENKQIVAFLKEYLAEDGVVCTMQNGLPEFSVAEVIGKKKTYGCAVAWGATFVGEGVSELTSEKLSFALGGLEPDELRLREIEFLLSRMGEVDLESNLMGARFSKLTVNAAFSGLSTATGETFGYIYQKAKTNRVALKIINECFAVAAAAGIRLEPIQGHDIQKSLTLGNPLKNLLASAFLKLAMKDHKDLLSGMLMDLKRGRKCDIDFINGTVCALGKKYGVETPYNDRVVEIVHGIENGLYELSPENIRFFEEA